MTKGAPGGFRRFSVARVAEKAIIPGITPYPEKMPLGKRPRRGLLVLGTALAALAATMAPAAHADYAMTRKDCALVRTVFGKIVASRAGKGALENETWAGSVSEKLWDYVSDVRRPARNRAIIDLLSEGIGERFGNGSGSFVPECGKNHPLINEAGAAGSVLRWTPVAGSAGYALIVSDASGDQIRTDVASGSSFDYAGSGLNSGEYRFEVYALDPARSQDPKNGSFSFLTDARVTARIATELNDGSIGRIRYENGAVVWDGSDLPNDGYSIMIGLDGQNIVDQETLQTDSYEAPFMGAYGGTYLVTVTTDFGKTASAVIALPRKSPLFEVKGLKIRPLAEGADEFVVSSAEGGEYSLYAQEQDAEGFLDFGSAMENSGLYGPRAVTVTAKSANGVALGRADLTLTFPPEPPAGE